MMSSVTAGFRRLPTASPASPISVFTRAASGRGVAETRRRHGTPDEGGPTRVNLPSHATNALSHIRHVRKCRSLQWTYLAVRA